MLRIFVVDNESDGDVIFVESSLIAKFGDGAGSEEEYWKKVERLTKRIRKAISKLYKKRFAEAHTFVSDNWWPNHTRRMECDTQAFTPVLLEALHALLEGEYPQWRILILIYDDLMNGTTHLGSITIWTDKLLVDRRVYDWMIANHFDFKTAEIHSIRSGWNKNQLRRLMNSP